MGKAMWGNTELELIQPIEGKSIHKDFLETRGEGLHHFGFDIQNYDEMFSKFVKAGFKPLQRIDVYYEFYKGFAKACYFSFKLYTFMPKTTSEKSARAGTSQA